MATIAIDFDHTIVDTLTQEPIPGAKDAICGLRERGHKVIIHSCNDPEHIERWMRNQNIPFDSIWEGVGKPVASVYIDDRAVGFRGDWDLVLEDVRTILATRTWL